MYLDTNVKYGTSSRKDALPIKFDIGTVAYFIAHSANINTNHDERMENQQNYS